jgi:hypothetical protein
MSVASDKTFEFLDATYHGFGDEASKMIREMSPDDLNDTVRYIAALCVGLVRAQESRLGLAPGAALADIRRRAAC